MKISIFGLGYVGCVGMGCLAEYGHKIIGVDLNSTKVDFVNNGKPTIIEKDIDKIIYRQWKNGNISATTDTVKAITESEISFICVGTPSTPTGHLNLDAVFAVAKQIGIALKEKGTFHVIAIRSTVTPGTNRKITEIISEVSNLEPETDFTVVSNPEFLREGLAIEDFKKPSITLVGTENKNAAQILKDVYANVDAPFIVSSICVAELMKYASNSFHALKITFANEIGCICKSLGVDSHELMEIFCMDTKLNASGAYLKPGFAYGGSCLPKDLKGLRTIAHDNYIVCPVIESIEISNENIKNRVCSEIQNFGKRSVGFVGLAFKSGTDDLRESPIIDVIEKLLGKGYDIKIYDKNVHISQLTGANREFILNKIPYIYKFVTDDLSEVLAGSETIVVVNNFENLEKRLMEIPEDKIIYDLARVWKSELPIRKNLFGIAWPVNSGDENTCEGNLDTLIA